MLWVAKLSSFLGGGKKQTKASNGARFIHLDLFESMREFTKNVEHGCVSYSKHLVVQNGMIYKWIKWYIKHICIYIYLAASTCFWATSSLHLPPKHGAGKSTHAGPPCKHHSWKRWIDAVSESTPWHLAVPASQNTAYRCCIHLQERVVEVGNGFRLP